MGAVSDTPPLARLLALGYRLMTAQLHERLRARGWLDVRPAYGFVLLAVRGSDTTTTDLAALLGTSKQATSKLLDAMEGARLVERSDSSEDRRIKHVTLARRGQDLLGVVEEIYEELEAEWATLIGQAGVEQTRRRLAKVILAANSGKFPPIAPE